MIVKLHDGVALDKVPATRHFNALRESLSEAAAIRVEPLVDRSWLVNSRAAAFGLDRVWKVELGSVRQAQALRDSLATLDDLVAYAELDAIGTVAQVLPDDPDFSLQWGLHNTGQTIPPAGGVPGTADADLDGPEAWEFFGGTSSVVVAIVDTGVDPHPEFAARLLEGIATAGDPYDTQDTCPHGTHVAGIIGAGRNDGLGMAGVHGGVWLLPVRVFDGCSGLESATAAGIIWAVDFGADIIAVPLSHTVGIQALQDAVDYAVAHDIMVIGAAGNSGSVLVGYPAAFDGCVAVSATTNEDTLQQDSSFGPLIDLAGPGKDIWSTWPGDDYAFDTGTSAAAAHAAGLAALVQSYAPQASPCEVLQVLMDSADDLGDPGWDEFFGAGRINAQQALAIAPAPALRVEHLAPLPDVVEPGSITSVELHIAEVGEQLVPDSAMLVYRLGSSQFTPVPLVELGGEAYQARLPAAPCETVIEYYFEAQGDGGTLVLDPLDAPATTYTALAIEYAPLFDDDFEDDLGWESIAEGGPETVGLWERVIPNGNAAQPYYDFSPDTGRFCYITDQYDGGSVGASDVDHGPVRLLSPVIPVDAPDAEIRYARWFHWSGVGQEDYLIVELSLDGGATWTVAETVGNASEWVSRSFRLSDFPALAGSSLRVRFSTSDLPNDSLTEAAVDEFHVRAIMCLAVSGDGDGDGDVDLDDFALMIDCLTGPGAVFDEDECEPFDFDLDRHVDLADYHEFVTFFGESR